MATAADRRVEAALIHQPVVLRNGQRHRWGERALLQALTILEEGLEAVEAVADGMVGAAGQPLRDTVPLVAQLIHRGEDELIFYLGP